MNKLSKEQRAQILQMLCEGMAIRAIVRMTGASKNTIVKLLADAGRACSAYQDRVFQNLPCKRVQIDELWSFIYAKRANLSKAKAAPQNAGDAWTWTAICSDTKLLITWNVGARDTDTAIAFLADLRPRLSNRIQLTSDGYKPYLEAVDTVFGDDVDYAILNKIYGQTIEGQRRYSPAKFVRAIKQDISGRPERKHVSTSYVERHNLTMRMHMRRFTRLTNGFSKKVENHVAAISLHAMFYNFVKLHQTLKASPAMAAGVTGRLWEMSDIVDVIDAWEAKQKRDNAPIFEVIGWKIGGGWYVRATLPGQEPERIEGFATESAAIRWIRQESKVWLHNRRLQISA